MLKIGKHLKVMQNMLKFKFSIPLIALGLLVSGCTSYDKPEREKRLVVLNENLDTVCVLEYRGDIVLQTKGLVRRKSASVYNNLWKQTTIVIGKDEKPIFKALGSK